MAEAATTVGTDARSDGYGPQGRSAWLDIDWPAQRRWVTIGGRPMNVIELGSGPPLLLIHGLGGSWQNWLETIPHFARAHRVIAPDLPGFGESPLPADSISIPGYGRAMRSLMDALEIPSAAVVGNSMGGFIGMELAVQFPERVERLVLVSAAGIAIEYQRREPIRTIARALEFAAGWVGAQADIVARRPRLRQLFLRTAAAHPERLPVPIAAEQLRASGKPGWLGAFDALLSYRIRPRLGEIRCPTLIVWGDRDRMVPVRDADEFERAIPGARKVIFRDTGHMAMIERPAGFNRVVEEFLGPTA
ncbi:MAG: alpha/beta hydrolase fold protein [Solirubrobacterales bacterium]|nr:alpha/beta hydrolase fold protein [Solirubrobacterales bacterium]